MNSNMNQWLAKTLKEKNKKPFPLLSYPGVQLMDVSLGQLAAKGDLQGEAMYRVAQKTDSLASVSFMDLSVEAEAFGAQIKFFDQEVPTVKGVLVANQEEADNLKVPPVGGFRTGEFIKGAAKARELISDRPVFAGMIGPFSLAGRLVDVNRAMVYCKKNPLLLTTVLEKVTEFLISYAKAYKGQGLHGVFIAEPLAGLLSPKLVEVFSEPYVRAIVEAVQDEDFIVLYHNCGDVAVKMTDSIQGTGCAAFHFGNAVNMKQVLEQMSPDKLVMGNIDPAALFVGGSPETMRSQVLELMEECGAFPNFVASSGCDIPHSAPWENIDAFFEAVRNYYGKAK
jgi:uroporphyrinogen decarboxylase